MASVSEARRDASARSPRSSMVCTSNSARLGAMAANARAWLAESDPVSPEVLMASAYPRWTFCAYGI